MIGLDTGFFVELLRKNSQAVEIWEGIIDGDESVVSCLTFYELKRLSLKGVIDSDALIVLHEAIVGICKVVWLDKAEILREAATISYSHGIHAIDSLLLASLTALNTKKVFTTDSHIEKYKKKGLSIINMIASSRS